VGLFRGALRLPVRASAPGPGDPFWVAVLCAPGWGPRPGSRGPLGPTAEAVPGPPAPPRSEV